jgi:poly(A) polymerase
VQSGTIPERFRPLVEATNELAERFRAAGHSLYLVGGSVRDALLPDDLAVPGDKRDFDLTTDALPEQIESLVSGWADAVWTTG